MSTAAVGTILQWLPLIVLLQSSVNYEIRIYSMYTFVIWPFEHNIYLNTKIVQLCFALLGEVGGRATSRSAWWLCSCGDVRSDVNLVLYLFIVRCLHEM